MRLTPPSNASCLPLAVRKEQERKKAAMARRKRRADPYADQSSAAEEDPLRIGEMSRRGDSA